MQTHHNEMFCWEVTNCQKKEACVAFKNPQKQCWELAQEIQSFQHEMSICYDCIVCGAKKVSLALVNQTTGAPVDDALPAFGGSVHRDCSLSQ